MSGGDDLLLEARDLAVAYRGVSALSGVSVRVPRGGFVAVLGPNGAGKSTLVRAVTGLLGLHRGRIVAGDVFHDGERVTRLRSHQLVRRGICQIPEGRKLFPGLTVEENLLVGASTRRDRAGLGDELERIWELFPGIAPRRHDHAVWLSGGEQQMVAVGRALMARPRLLVCDELSLGLAPRIVQQLFDVLRRINVDLGTTILLIEQNALLSLEYADYAYVFETGTVVLEGQSAELRDNADVRQFYLGIAVDGAIEGPAWRQ